MGLDVNLARFLLEARHGEVSFSRCIMLGRQNYFVGNTETRRLLRDFGYDPSRFPRLFGNERPKYSEPFLEVLGSKETLSLDASGFEGADIVHDLNEPMPAEFDERFDVVWDAGTLEHVFNYPVAIRNCMNMVKVGGHLLQYTGANNYFGHGFYQFSPELLFRLLGPDNGFCVERMVAVEYGPRYRRFAVSDPAAIRRRVNLINSHPVMLFVQAKRERRVPILAAPPQQSDYVAQWRKSPDSGQNGVCATSRRRAQRVDWIKQILLERAPALARFLEACRNSSWNRSFSFRDRKAFRRLRG